MQCLPTVAYKQSIALHRGMFLDTEAGSIILKAYAASHDPQLDLRDEVT